MRARSRTTRWLLITIVLMFLLTNLLMVPVSSLQDEQAEPVYVDGPMTILDAPPSWSPLDAPVERPYGNGPYTAGWTYDNIWLSEKAANVRARAYYPADANSEDAGANTTGAPYPLIVFAPGAGQDEDDYGVLGQNAASWGIMFIIIGYNWGIGSSGSVQDYRDVMDYYIAANASAPHILYQMMDFDKVASGGHSHGGRRSALASPYIPEFSVHISLSPSISQAEVNSISNDWDLPMQLHTGTTDPLQGHVFMYNTFDVVKETVTTVGGGHAGPFDWASALAFMFFHFNDDQRYEYWIFKKGIMIEIANENVTLKYDRLDGRFFPPEVNATLSVTEMFEDEEVWLNVTIEGYYDPEFGDEQFCWDYEQDGESDRCGADPENVTAVYTEAGGYFPKFNYSLGTVEIAEDTPPSVLTVTNVAPTAAIEASTIEVPEDVRVDFDASASSDTASDLPLLEFMFEFDDGETRPWDPSPLANHTYSTAGLKDVTVSVRDDDHFVETASVSVNVTNSAPVIEDLSDVVAWEDQPLSFNAVGNDTPSDSLDLRYLWDLGDGNVTAWKKDSDVEHTYYRKGTYNVTASVKDNDDVVVETTFKVTVKNALPVVTIKEPLPESTFKEDEVVLFSGEATDNSSDLPFLLYSWDFGDGAASEWANDASASHVYRTSGTFDSVLRTMDDDGDIGTMNRSLEIRNIKPYGEILDGDIPASVEEDEEIFVKSLVDDTPSDLPLLNVSWSIESLGLVFYGQNATILFTKQGMHTLLLTVRDDDGSEATDSVKVTVTNVLPSIEDARINRSSVEEGEDIGFSANATDTPSDNDLLTYTWDMGDGTKYTGSSGNHTYTKAGTYDIVLTVKDDDQFGKVERTIRVQVKEKEEPVKPPPPPPPPPSNGNVTVDRLSTQVIAGIVIGIVVIVVLLVAIVMSVGRGPPAPKGPLGGPRPEEDLEPYDDEPYDDEPLDDEGPYDELEPYDEEGPPEKDKR
jgi:PKD repeat protein